MVKTLRSFLKFHEILEEKIYRQCYYGATYGQTAFLEWQRVLLAIVWPKHKSAAERIPSTVLWLVLSCYVLSVSHSISLLLCNFQCYGVVFFLVVHTWKYSMQNVYLICYISSLAWTMYLWILWSITHVQQIQLYHCRKLDLTFHMGLSNYTPNTLTLRQQWKRFDTGLMVYTTLLWPRRQR